MNIKEARKIVGKMVQWTMIANGVPISETPELITEDLPTLLKANNLVKRANKISQTRISKIVKEKGSWSGTRKMSMTIADRGIAALYVAANFTADNVTEADVIAQHGNAVVYVFDKRTIDNEQE